MVKAVRRMARALDRKSSSTDVMCVWIDALLLDYEYEDVPVSKYLPPECDDDDDDEERPGADAPSEHDDMLVTDLMHAFAALSSGVLTKLRACSARFDVVRTEHCGTMMLVLDDAGELCVCSWMPDAAMVDKVEWCAWWRQAQRSHDAFEAGVYDDVAVHGSVILKDVRFPIVGYDCNCKYELEGNNASDALRYSFEKYLACYNKLEPRVKHVHIARNTYAIHIEHPAPKEAVKRVDGKLSIEDIKKVIAYHGETVRRFMTARTPSCLGSVPRVDPDDEDTLLIMIQDAVNHAA